jgi:GlcNAc-P-P-Und epimerase
MKALVTGGSGFIGTHLVAHLVQCGYEVNNIDCAPPSDKSQGALWKNVSILDGPALQAAFQEFQPQYVVHLAACAAMEARSLDEFRPNTEGTENVLQACQESPSLERVIITSTQHVRRPGSGPARSETDFAPYMTYGETKVITERLTRAANLKCGWTIIRPTAVWGPGHLSLAGGLWRLMAQGKYFHPSVDPVIRSFGYVKNVAWQIEKILQADRAAVNGKVFYVADGNIRQSEWINAFARALTGRNARTVPVSFIHFLAIVGDAFKAVGLRFPMYGARFQNLITPNPVPVEPTLELFGTPPFALEPGVAETVHWLKSYYQSGK